MVVRIEAESPKYGVMRSDARKERWQCMPITDFLTMITENPMLAGIRAADASASSS